MLYWMILVGLVLLGLFLAFGFIVLPLLAVWLVLSGSGRCLLMGDCPNVGWGEWTASLMALVLALAGGGLAYYLLNGELRRRYGDAEMTGVQKLAALAMDARGELVRNSAKIRRNIRVRDPMTMMFLTFLGLAVAICAGKWLLGL